MGELERRRAANIAENQAMRRHLGLPVEAEAGRRASGSGRGRQEGGRDVATTHRRPATATQSRAVGPHGLRSRTAEGSASPARLTFARLHARGLYRELDEAVRELGARLAAEVETRLVSLLDDAPSDSKGEYLLVQGFVNARSIACAFYRHGSASGSPTEVALLVVEPDLEQTARVAVATALLAYVASFAALRRREVVEVDFSNDMVLASAISVEGAAIVEEDTTLRLFLQLSMLGDQTEYLQRAVQKAEVALRAAGAEAAVENDIVAIWVDRTTCSDVALSQHFAAVRLHRSMAHLPVFSGSADDVPLGLSSNTSQWHCEYQWIGGTTDGKTKQFDEHMLLEISPRDAADREMSLICGYATSERGTIFDASKHCWCRLAFEVGGLGWGEHLAEEAEGAPQLLFSWSDDCLDLMKPTAHLVFRRARAHQQHKKQLPPAHWTTRQSTEEREQARAERAARAASFPQRSLMLECFCGEAPLACCMRDRHPMQILGLDVERRKVWRNEGRNNLPDGVPACDGQQRHEDGHCTCGKLHEDELLHYPFCDLPLDPEELLGELGGLAPVWTHSGIECDTWSQLGTTKRDKTNCYMGVSKLEYEANVNLQHLVALYFLLRRLRPHAILTLENPGFDKGLCMHPLTRFVIEAPMEEGGLGLKLIPTSYCLYGRDEAQKVTFFWSNSRNHAHKSIEIMSDGTPRLLERCGKGDCSCGDLKKHGARRNHVRGAGHSRNTDTCVHPRPNLLRPCFGHSFGERNEQ